MAKQTDKNGFPVLGRCPKRKRENAEGRWTTCGVCNGSGEECVETGFSYHYETCSKCRGTKRVWRVAGAGR